MSDARSDRGGAETATGQLGPNSPLHAKSFKLRFASHRELGRSYVSAVKPLGLPAVVSGKFYRREPEGEVEEELAERALARVRDMFGRGPREKRSEPLTTSSEYGWWRAGGAGRAAGAGRAGGAAPLGLQLRDSAWLKERARLAADAGLARR